MENVPCVESVPDPILDAGEKFFGIHYLFPYQRLAIYNILNSCGFFGALEDAFGDQIILLPTGAGKSLCFQLPALLLPGLTLVVYPLLSLMADQYRRLREAKVSVGILKGGQSEEERASLFRSLKNGELKIILSNPETLGNPRTLEALVPLHITHFVVDEAHCIAQWGETFRPAYLNLAHIRATLKPKVTTAFTATASPFVVEKIREHLFEGTYPHQISANPDRPNIQYFVMETLSKQRTLRTILSATLAKEGSQRPALVFCRSRKRTEGLALTLRHSLQEREIFFYHAGLSPEEKKRIERWFFHSSTGILVATTAYGMGVDKPNIRTVIHEEAPETVEAYLQESGRGGRDTQPCQAILLVSEEDRFRLSPFFRGYVSTQECRRLFLYRGLGLELEGCSGCDRCNRKEKEGIEGRELFLAFFRKNSRRYTEDEVIHLLGGRSSLLSVSHALYRSRWYGILREWDFEEIEEALENLSRQGRIRRGTLLWKNRLYLSTK